MEPVAQKTLPCPALDSLDEVQISNLVATLPEEGQQRIRESGKAPVENPLTHSGICEALRLIALREQEIRDAGEAHKQNRSSLRAMVDRLFQTGKEHEVLRRKEVEGFLGKLDLAYSPRSILESLQRAGLVVIETHIPDSESGAGTIACMYEYVTVTERGKTLLTVNRQPPVLLAL